MSKKAEEIYNGLQKSSFDRRRDTLVSGKPLPPGAARKQDLDLIDEKLSGVRDIIKSMADTELEYQEQILSGNISKSLLASITEYPAIKLYESLKVD